MQAHPAFTIFNLGLKILDLFLKNLNIGDKFVHKLK